MREKLAKAGYTNLGEVYANLTPAQLVEESLFRGEGVLSSTGALAVETGQYTGRSPKDRFIVETLQQKDEINWGNINQPFNAEKYAGLKARQQAYLQGRDVFVFDGFIGADPEYSIAVRVINECAWQNLFIHQLLRRPTAEQLECFKPEVTLVGTPNFKAIPELDGTNSEAFVILNLEEKEILIGTAAYAGEMKKACFSLMNYFMPARGVCPMHCSANIGADGSSALFFGLSGTGKTTLSADPHRSLIGDDEHGWSPKGIFNFEGGCYAKAINLTRESEPQIWDAIKFGAVIENVAMDEETRLADYDDDTLTENIRTGYPLESIPNAEPSGMGGHPKTVIFLTADAFGVLPPISRLDSNQASYYYLSGYTSKLAGTERGITEPQATFSAGFGEPFLPRPVRVYAEILRKSLEEHGTQVYMLNTGWTGGPYGEGSRMKLGYTRAMLNDALNGELDDVEFVKDPIFGLSMPTSCPGVPDEILNPRETWENKDNYDKTATKLAKLFVENFKHYDHVDINIVNAGPKE